VLRLRDSWARIVALSAVIVAGTVIGLGAWWAATSQSRVSTFVVSGSLNGVELDLGGAGVEVIGGGPQPQLEVRRDERFALGQRPVVQRRIQGGVLRVRARCPASVPTTCSASYRLRVPDNVPVTVRTDSGDVRFSRFRGSAMVATVSGDVSVGTFCGFLLQARTDTGDVRVGTTCPLERMMLRSRSGDVRAVVPPGRYRVDAESDHGSTMVTGVEPVEDAPYQLQALSSAGRVTVEAAR
jgi:hypothetical protein